jgi:ankyrin repeat protein
MDAPADGGHIFDETLNAEFIETVEKGDGARIKELLVRNANPNARNCIWQTALMRASLRGHTTVVQELLKAHASIDAQSGKHLMTALMFAAAWGKIDVVRILLDEGANVDAQNIDGWTALMFASRRGFLDIVHILLDAGADVALKNNEENTVADVALLWISASKKEQVDTASFLNKLVDVRNNIENIVVDEWAVCPLEVIRDYVMFFVK